MRKVIWQTLFVTLLNLMLNVSGFGQGALTTNELAHQYNPVLTAVPFLLISPDARAGGMGDQGVATEADEWSMHWNPAKYATETKDFGIGLSYTPWLKNLGVKDVSQSFLTGFGKIDNMQTVAFSLLYFNMGTIEATDGNGVATGVQIVPREIAFDGAYARKLSKDFSFSLALRYLNSNLVGSSDVVAGARAIPGQSVAADISGFYEKEAELNKIPVKYRWGFNIANVGAKVNYSASGEKEFIPTTLRLGGGVNAKIDQFNEFGLSVEATKLLVPTNQYVDSIGYLPADQTTSVPVAIIHSFYDAPGGALEEWHEITWGAGAEYWYMRQFALRGGYFYENMYKGNRKYFTFGFGLRMTMFGLDASYIVPRGGNSSPLANTWRMSLTYNFDRQKAGGGKKKAAMAPTQSL